MIFYKNYVQELHYTHKYLWKMNVFPKKDPRNNELWSENFESFGGKRFFLPRREFQLIFSDTTEYFKQNSSITFILSNRLIEFSHHFPVES